MNKTLYVFTDGGARGNPGPAAVAFIVKDNRGRVLIQNAKPIGRATNNVAEYTAVIEALKWIKENYELRMPRSFGDSFGMTNCEFFLDSKLVVNQLNGVFKIKNKNLRNLIIEIRKLEQEVGGNVSYHFIPREKNHQADFLVQKILSQNKSPRFHSL